jgi:hypothetical protein
MRSSTKLFLSTALDEDAQSDRRQVRTVVDDDDDDKAACPYESIPVES